MPAAGSPPVGKPSMAFFHSSDTQKAKVVGVADRRIPRRQTCSIVCYREARDCSNSQSIVPGQR